MRIIVLLSTIFLLAFFISCEKDIDFDIEQNEALLVVDGRIEHQLPPYIVLTKSLSYFKSFNAQTINNNFVHNAVVTIFNGTKTDTLVEYSQPVSPGFSIYYYSTKAAAIAPIVGELNKTYELTIFSEGKTYTSKTTIPLQTATLDSIWVKPQQQNPDTLARNLFLRITDPPGKGNYVRYFTQTGTGNFFPGENSVFDDQIIDGTTFDVQLSPGLDKNDPLPSDSNYFRKGDSITLKFCNIDKPTYTFWNTWEFAFQSVGNPFAQPNVVIGNISNGALGAFCGYAPRYRSLVAE